METQPSPKEDKVFQIINRILTQVFGEDATRTIYGYLEREHSLKPSDFSENIDVFAKGLEEFLSSGAYFIQNKILSEILAAQETQPSLDMQIAVNVGTPELNSPLKNAVRN
jgi:hypothetical protein